MQRRSTQAENQKVCREHQGNRLEVRWSQVCVRWAETGRHRCAIHDTKILNIPKLKKTEFKKGPCKFQPVNQHLWYYDSYLKLAGMNIWLCCKASRRMGRWDTYIIYIILQETLFPLNQLKLLWTPNPPESGNCLMISMIQPMRIRKPIPVS